MRVDKSSPKPNSLAPNAASRGRGFLPIALAVLASAFSFTPTAVHADTPVKGFFTDEEEAPAADAKVAVTATAAPQVQAQVNVAADANAAVAVEGDEYDVDTDPSALTDFREPLADYGSWSDDETYGTVWYPDTTIVGTDFAPYQTSGHWELDVNNDWMWVSDYDWGYIPFHYGRWVWIGGRGWGWIPGRVYAPAWVTWRMTDYGYIGWAPMAPSWYWFGGNAVTVWSTPYSAYVFCPSSHVFHHHVHTYIVRDRDVIQRVGAHSRPYRPARPSVGASPSGSSAHARAYRPASPRLAEAKVADQFAPEKRSKPDARAAAFAHRSSTPQARTNAAEARRLHASQLPTQRDPSAARPNPGDARPSTLTNPANTARPTARTNAVENRPVSRTVTDARVNTPPSRPATTTHTESRTPTPHTESRTPTPKTTRPTTITPQPSRPSTTPSRPSTTPSRPSTTPSRPSVSPSRPSFSPSRPSSSPSRSFSPSRGGRR
jgi:hypothetical protein